MLPVSKLLEETPSYDCVFDKFLPELPIRQPAFPGLADEIAGFSPEDLAERMKTACEQGEAELALLFKSALRLCEKNGKVRLRNAGQGKLLIASSQYHDVTYKKHQKKWQAKITVLANETQAINAMMRGNQTKQLRSNNFLFEKTFTHETEDGVAKQREAIIAAGLAHHAQHEFYHDTKKPVAQAWQCVENVDGIDVEVAKEFEKIAVHLTRTSKGKTKSTKPGIILSSYNKSNEDLLNRCGGDAATARTAQSQSSLKPFEQQKSLASVAEEFTMHQWKGGFKSAKSFQNGSKCWAEQTSVAAMRRAKEMLRACDGGQAVRRARPAWSLGKPTRTRAEYHAHLDRIVHSRMTIVPRQ
jgi:hypothetical protein